VQLGANAHGGQGAVQAVVVVPDQSIGALVDLSGPLLGVDHEHPAGADDQVIHVGRGAGHGQVVQNLVAVPVQAVQQPGGLAFAAGAAPPGAGLLRGAEPQPPGHQGSDGQAGQPGPRHASLAGEGADDQAGGNREGCSPGQAAGPGG
jgi:hypothetical protein